MLGSIQEGGVRCRTFFNFWTRKEAYFKARGHGLVFASDQVDVAPVTGESRILLTVNRELSETVRWSLIELHAGPGYAATLAVEGHCWRLCCWQVPDAESVFRTPDERGLKYQVQLGWDHSM
jgi:phosphopantetheinyl transferase